MAMSGGGRVSRYEPPRALDLSGIGVGGDSPLGYCATGSGPGYCYPTGLTLQNACTQGFGASAPEICSKGTGRP